MPVLYEDEHPVPWDLFEQQASRYEGWYATLRGQRVDSAERALLKWLLQLFPDAHSVLEVGCGTGHFTVWFAQQGLQAVGLDRAPAMLAALRRRAPEFPVILGDAHWLPIREEAVDLVVFVTTLEFLEDPQGAVSEAVRVARRGVVLVVLNRWSLGGFSRRWEPQARGALLGQARDYSLVSLQALVRRAAGKRVQTVRWTSTLFPSGLWRMQGHIPLGDVIGMAMMLAAPAVRSTTVQTLKQEAE